MTFRIELEREEDGRWIAEVLEFLERLPTARLGKKRKHMPRLSLFERWPNG
jgi:hypothetical protein